jgi:5-methyltetrahydropteroyltriglutamate--homocysteine methyltransferase
MVQSVDVGSLPFVGNMDKFVEGMRSFEAGLLDESANYFKKTIVDAFLDKLVAGVDIPNFPQFRDMNEMFLSMLASLEKLKKGYVEIAHLALKHGMGCLPEVSVIRKNARLIGEEFGKPFKMRVCVTGPYTLASFFPYRTSETFVRLGEVLSQVVNYNVFCDAAGCVEMVSVDEPVFGMVDDALIDRGSGGRESLLKAWEMICRSAKAKGVKTCIHLHNTSDDLFWGVGSLDVVESHVDDPLYQMSETKKRLEAGNKVLKACACAVDFDGLIGQSVVQASSQRLNDLALNEMVAETWRKLRKGAIVAEDFLEPVSVMEQRIAQVVGRFGVERVPYAGPECGLRGFPSYACAVECLRRVAEAARKVSV